MSLKLDCPVANPEECPFCDMGERVIIENEHANLFLSNPRKVEAHVLVAPKRHIELPWETTDDELVAIFGLINIARQRLAKEYGGGVDVRQNYRPFMKQGRIKVDHLHYHVYPRTNEDELYQQVERHETEMFVDLPPEEATKIAKLFK